MAPKTNKKKIESGPSKYDWAVAGHGICNRTVLRGNDRTKTGINRTKHTKPEIYNTELVNELNGMV